MKFDDMTSAGYWPVNPLYKVEILSSEKVGSGDSAEWVVTYSYKRNRYAWYNEESLQNNKNLPQPRYEPRNESHVRLCEGRRLENQRTRSFEKALRLTQQRRLLQE